MAICVLARADDGVGQNEADGWKRSDYVKLIRTNLCQDDCSPLEQKNAKPCGWPCGGVISSRYGFRFHPVSKCRKFHKGIDIASVPNTYIRCTACGRVVFSGWLSGYGCMVVVDHGAGYRTVYAHLSEKYVSRGDTVSRGQIVAKIGNSGTVTRGHHLHYEVYLNGKTVNPELYLCGFRSMF